ncbi:peptidoglycan editing factor PgeF [Martelella soudanensis]|uniref:peptidoglycan editing factor PgeF n=1 Tax=unclassified Martelella TaxID=2629616 RepID=UPI0015DFAC6D|nr:MULTISPECIES: peptidoglycan editing factor PgeF [unclassified Martelella]
MPDTATRDALSPMQSPLLEERLAGTDIRHGFFTRRGGVSTGLYDSLNCGIGSDDRPEAVAENRARVAGWFDADADQLVTLYQCHSADAIAVSGPQVGERPHADGMASATPGIVLGVLTADCGPLLFADPENEIIAAAHAGWRGAFGGIIEATIEKMVALGARRRAIIAALGPTIGPENYEVGPEFVERFTSAAPALRALFRPSPSDGHAWFDLPGFIGLRLDRAGIEHDIIRHCTYQDEKGFYSYRRGTHQGEKDYGRQISAISIL